MSLLAFEKFPTLIALFFLLQFAPRLTLTFAKPYSITFRSPSLYPEGLAWDIHRHHFLVGSFRSRTISSVTDAGAVETVIHDTSLPENSTILGLAVDSVRHRLLVVVHSMPPLPLFDALATYDLRTRRRIFLALLPRGETDITLTRPIANDVAVDMDGNAYVTNAAGNFIWKVNGKGEPSIFSKSPLFTKFPVNVDPPFSECGLNGVVFHKKGFLLVVQSNTGKMFKVNAEDGSARLVALNEDLSLPDDIAVRSDGVVLVVSPYKLRFLKSSDDWGEGVVYDKTELQRERFPTSVAVRDKDRAYVLYGHVEEVMMGNAERAEFGIEEVSSEKESKEEKVWIYVLAGLGLAYFLFWRFQMKKLIGNMDKKIN